MTHHGARYSHRPKAPILPLLPLSWFNKCLIYKRKFHDFGPLVVKSEVSREKRERRFHPQPEE